VIHTLNLSKTKTRIFSLCHERRNLAEYEGHLHVDGQLLSELIAGADELLVLVNDLFI
jgi:hypothetical protein